MTHLLSFEKQYQLLETPVHHFGNRSTSNKIYLNDCFTKLQHLEKENILISADKKQEIFERSLLWSEKFEILIHLKDLVYWSSLEISSCSLFNKINVLENECFMRWKKIKMFVLCRGRHFRVS